MSLPDVLSAGVSTVSCVPTWYWMRWSRRYGSGVARLLASGPVRAVAKAMPGLIKLTLEPPVDVEAVAGAVVKAVVSEEEGAMVVDGTEAITTLANS